jgi:AraC-like DNA-binding protein/mannose-6-phosphate isomerase-like protein (cupin superfamily)
MMYGPDMTVTARSAKSLAGAANPAAAGATVRAGTYSVELGDEVVTGWHSHDLHQLEYAFEGIAEVQTETARFLLPPQQAVWIPAGVDHCSTLTRVKTVSVFFDPSMGLPAGDRVRILAAAPVIREMILYARRWPMSREGSEPMADAFFAALAYLVAEWLDHETPLCLPTASDPLVAAAMDYADDHLADATMGEMCREVGTSERSLRRAFVADTGMSWRRYLQESRLLKAMALLAESDLSLLDISLAVGFDSASAFTRSFRRYAGESPSEYRRRVRTPHSGPASISPTSSERVGEVIRGWSHLGRSARADPTLPHGGS